MSLSFLLTNLIGALLLPPLNLLLAAIAGLLLARAHPRLGRTLLWGALALLWLCSTPYFASSALRLLESSLKAVDTRTQTAGAIVVLGGGSYFDAPEYGTDTVSEASLARLRYGAKLQRETGKPILVTGGNPLGNDLSEAQQMKSVLEEEFKVRVRWTEDASNNTLENARYSYRILQQAGIRRVYLVTHAWHMPRSIQAFESAGFEVVPAPTRFASDHDPTVLNFLPAANGLEDSRNFMHEVIGMLWYWLKTSWS